LAAEVDDEQSAGRMEAEPKQVGAGSRDRDLPQQLASRIEDEELTFTGSGSARGEAKSGHVDFPAGTHLDPLRARRAVGQHREDFHLASVPSPRLRRRRQKNDKEQGE
jgi:hypothetical protein